MIRILQVLGNMERGGIQYLLMQLARRLDRQHFRLDFLLADPHPQVYDDELRGLGCRLLYAFDVHRPWRYARDFATAVQAHGPYAVVHGHVYHYNGFVMRLAARHGVPVRLAHAHDDQRALPANRRLNRRLYHALMRRWIRRHATCKVAASTAAAAALFGPHWERDPTVRLVPSIMDPAPFFAAAGAGERRRRDLGLPPGVPVVGHVGRFAEQKNHAFLLEVIANMAARAPQLHAVLVGDGPLRPALEARARALGIARRIVFTGARDDVPELLDAMDVFVFPSLHEGLGIVLLEAQASGLPCVFSDRVPDDAVVLPELMHRVALEQPPARWADVALAALARPAVRRDAARQAFRAGPFDLARFVQTFAELYGAPAPARPAGRVAA